MTKHKPIRKSLITMLSFLMVFGMMNFMPGPQTPVANAADSDWPAASMVSYSMPFRPENSLVTTQNPPDFSWPFVTGADGYELQVSRDADFKVGNVAKDVSLTRNFYNFPDTFEAGTWYWRVSYHKPDGSTAWSTVRKFRIEADSVSFVVPSVDTMMTNVTTAHPRIWTTPDTLEQFKGLADTTGKSKYQSTLATVQATLDDPLPAEPVFPYLGTNEPTNSENYVNAQRDLRAATDAVLNQMMNTAFVYLVSDDPDIRAAAGAKAKAQLLNVASWDPDGSTNFIIQDQVHRAIAYKSAIVYDWVYGLLSDEDKEAVQAMVSERVETLIQQYLVTRPLYLYPYDSHGWTILGYIGIIATAMLHDVDDAEDWFRESVPVYINLLPPWGGENGSWSQGTGYWQWSSMANKELMDVLLSAGAIDLYQKSFSRNEGFYPLYMFPHGTPKGVFGDDNTYAPGAPSVSMLNRISQMNGDARLKWESEAIGATPGMGLADYFYGDAALDSRPPVDLPNAKWFEDTGLVAMHSDLIDRDRISFYFRSNSYGTAIHNQADQNAFIINAYGESLAPKTGFYDYYGSNHHYNYTRQTFSANAITFDGKKGQPVEDFSADGQILGFVTSPNFDATSGDATAAYKGALTKAVRHILYLRPDMFVVIDDLATSKAGGSNFEWNLHGEDSITIDADEQGATVTKGKANLNVQFYTAEPMSSTYTTQYLNASGAEVSPVGTYASEQQAHAQFITPKTKATKIISTMEVYKTSEETHDVVSDQQSNYTKLTFDGGTEDDTIVYVRTSDSGLITTNDDIQFDAAAIAIKDDTVLMVNGAKVIRDDVTLISSDELMTVTFGDEQLSMSGTTDAQIALNAPDVVRVRDFDSGADIPSGGDIDETVKQNGVHWTKSDDTLTLHVESGQKAFKLNEAPMPAPTTSVVLQTEIDGVLGSVTLQSWTDINGETVSWGNLVNDAGFYEVEEAPAGFSFAKYGHAHTAILDANTPIVLRGDTGVLKINNLGSGDPTPAVQSINPDSDRAALAMDWQEAENFMEWGGAKAPTIYDTRDFLSGGKGINNWDQTGMSVKWKFDVPKAGTYDLYIKYVAGWDLPAGVEVATRFLQIGDKITYFQAPKTIDFGATPDTWRGLRVKTGLTLPAGPIDVTMWHQLGSLNLDYLALIEVKDDELRPSTPELQLEAQGAASVDLSWTESTDPAIPDVTTGMKDYVVYANGEEKAVVPYGTTTATVPGLSRGETYTFTVKARDVNDNLSMASNSVTAVFQELTAPVWGDFPSIQLDGLFPKTVRLSWDSAIVNEGDVTYTIYKKVGENFEAIGTTKETSYNATLLQTSTAYTFKVKAANDVGTFAEGGPEITVTTPATVSNETFFESFDDWTIGDITSNPTNWTITTPTVTGKDPTIVRVVDLGSGNKGLKLIDNLHDSSNPGDPNILYKESPVAQMNAPWPYVIGGKATLETRVQFTKGSTAADSYSVELRGQSWKLLGAFKIADNGGLTYLNSTSNTYQQITSSTPSYVQQDGEWMKLRFDFDFDAKTFDLTVQADSLKSYTGGLAKGSLDRETGTIVVTGIPFLDTAVTQIQQIIFKPQFGLGEYTLDYLTLYRAGDVPQNSAISLTKANFDKNAAAALHEDVAVDMTLNGNTLTGITNNGAALDEGTDYTIEGSTIKIKKEYLADQPEGVVPLTFNFSVGATKTLAITVFDSTLPNGSVNLSTNGSYEMDTASPPGGWSIYSAQTPDTYTVSVDGTQHKSGIQSVKISVQSGTSVTLYQSASVTAGQSYKYSTWVRKQDTASTARLSYSFRDGAGNVITPPGFVNLSPSVTAEEDDNGWVLIESVVTAPPESAVLVIGNFATAGTTWYDDVQLVEWNSVTSLSLDKAEETIAIGDTLQIHATVLPADATNPAIVWTSSNPEVATVDQEGNVTAIKGGTAIITAKTEENGFEQQCIVQVSSNEDITVDNDTAQTQIGVPVSGQVTAVDANGHDLTYSLAVPAANGVVNVSFNGSWTYTPSIGFYGTDEFRVGVEDGYGNYTFSIITVTVKSLADTLSGFEDVHPRLYLDNDKIDQLQLAVQPGGTHAALWNEFKLLVDAQLAETVPAYYTDPSEEELWEREVANKTVNFAFAYLMTGDDKYKKAAIDWALASASYPTWGRGGDATNASLSAGHQLFSLAIVYDWLYYELDGTTKNTLLTALKAHGEEMYKKATGLPFNGRTVKVFSGSSYLHNHMYISIGGLSAAAMAIFDEAPDAVDWFGYAMTAFGKTESLLADDGASHEGFPYWEYGTEWLIKYAKLAEKFVGSHMLQNDWFKNASAYVAYSMLGENDWRYNSSFLNIGDNEGINYAGPDHILRVLAAENRDGLAQWMADQVAEKHLATRSAEWLGILYYDPTVEATPVSAEPTMHWFDNLDLVVSRTDWSGDESIVAFTSGPPQGHKELDFPGNFGGGHEHPDANHFLIYANGEYLIRDDGYADKLTSNHNTLLINGTGQIGEGARWFDNGLSKAARSDASILKAVSEDGFDYMLGDATSAYSSSTGLTKYQRHLIFLKPDILIVVDDIETASPQNLELRYFPESETIQTLPDGDYLLISPNNTLRFQPLATDGATVSADKVAYKSDKLTGNRLALRVRSDGQTTLRTAVAFTWSKGTTLPTEITLDQQGDVWKFEAGTEAVELNFATQSVTEVEGSGSAVDMSDASLASLTINGKLIAGFSPETYTYTHVYTDKKPVPVLSYVLNSAAASAVVDYDGAVPGVATLEVTAGDGTEKTYTVHIEASRILPIYGATSNGTTGFNPDAAYDDNLDTYWSAKVDPILISEDNPDGYPSIVFDLNEAQLVNEIGINWYNGPGRQFVFDIEASEDAVNWTRIYSGEGDGVTDGEELYDVADVKARYVRVIGHGTKTSVFFSIDEIYIYRPPVQNSTIAPETASFDKSVTSAVYGDVSVEITLNGNTLTGIEKSGDALVVGTDYTVDVSTVKILKEYLVKQPVGTTNLTFTFSEGAAQTLAIAVSDSNLPPAQNSVINPITATFDKSVTSAVYGDVSVAMTLHGNMLTGIANSGHALVEGTDYTVDVNTDTVKILKEYLAKQPIGTTNLTFTFSAGATQTLAIAVSDSALPPVQNSVINPATGSFDKKTSAQADFEATMTLNGNTLVSIKNGTTVLDSGKDYKLSGNTVTIKKNYLSTLAKGTTSLTFTFSAGVTQTLVITVTDTTDNGQNPDNGSNTSPGTGNNVNDGSIGVETTTTVNNRQVTKVALDPKKLEGKLAAAGNGAVITVPVQAASEVAIGELTGLMMQGMEQKQAVLQIQTDKATYTIPAGQINIGEIAKRLGNPTDLQDVTVQVEIAEPDADTVKVVENAANQGQFEIVVPPLNFTIRASYGDSTIEIDTFSAYVDRLIAIPSTVDPKQVTTAIVVNPDGTVRHVPTQIVEMNGQYYAKVSSLTNSTYSLISHPVAFTDLVGHWAQATVNDMGSRMIVSGIGDDRYNPDADITRAEFAAIIVRGLGLGMEAGATDFPDVTASAWYNSAVKTALLHQLINGFDGGTFRPTDKITREQAMVIIAKAMTITGLKTGASSSERLGAFADAASVSGWAKDSVAACLEAGIVFGRSSTVLAPKDTITRAEVAVIVQRLLEKSDLI